MDVRRLAAVLVGCGALMAAGGLVGYRASHECTQVGDRQVRFAYPMPRSNRNPQSTVPDSTPNKPKSWKPWP
jgi:hypothetical protein